MGIRNRRDFLTHWSKWRSRFWKSRRVPLNVTVVPTSKEPRIKSWQLNMLISQTRLWLKHVNKFAEPAIPLTGMYVNKYLDKGPEKTVTALLEIMESWEKSIDFHQWELNYCIFIVQKIHNKRSIWYKSNWCKISMSLDLIGKVCWMSREYNF